MTLQSIDEYGPSFQMKVISSLLTHKEFLQNINDVLSDEYFSNPAHKWVINEIIKYYEKFHTTISMDILKVEMKKLDNEVLKVSVKEQLREAYKADLDDLAYVQEEFSTFCKNQQLKKALLSSVDLLKADKGENDDYLKLVTKKMKDYLKDGSKGEYNANPEFFPKGNGQLAKMAKKAYEPTEDVEEYIEDFAYGGGMENLDYDKYLKNQETREALFLLKNKIFD